MSPRCLPILRTILRFLLTLHTLGIVCLTLSAQTSPATGRQPNKKAILIGINCYDPTYASCAKLKNIQPTNRVKRAGVITGDWLYWKFGNLQGAVNDVEMMKSILEAEPHNFEIPADAVLLDERATADAILFTLRKYLIDDAQEGDLRVVYYSGHGNYVRNTAVADPKEFDETIVPSDHWRGTPDIRDKELSRILAEAGKKVKIVFIADSCHSGSLSRGPAGRAKTALSGAADDPKAPKVEDKPSADDPAKARYGLIFLSAARRDQPALETDGRSDDISDPFTGPHGAFTWALKKAFDGYGNAPIDTVYERAASFLAVDKPAQAPNLEGLNRSQINLFGEKADGAALQRAVVENVSPSGEIRLRGGPAVGIYEGTGLKRVSKGATTIEIQVTKEDGLAHCLAKVTEHGNGTVLVQKGDLFEVDKWVVPADAMLDLYIAPAISATALSAAAKAFAKLQSDLGANWVEDETETVATHVLQWNGKTWTLDKYVTSSNPVDLGATPSATDVRGHLPPDAKLLLVIPPSPELLEALPFGRDTHRIRMLKSPTDATYWLRGHLNHGVAEFAWVRPESSVPALRTKLDTMPLPPRSEWIPLDQPAGKVAAGDLADKAYGLGRIREWQMLHPAGPAKDGFPYKLVFHELGSDRELSSGEVIGGKQYKMYLRADDADLKALHYSVVPRFTYVFAIDKFGTGTLLFPPKGAGNQDNTFPIPVSSGETKPPAPALISISGPRQEYDFDVQMPYGTDTYFLLTSLEPIANPDILDFSGVRTRGGDAPAGPQDPLAAMLSQVGTMTRSPKPVVPTSWSIDKVYLKSKAPEK
jgi:hypothetical protein